MDRADIIALIDQRINEHLCVHVRYSHAAPTAPHPEAAPRPGAPDEFTDAEIEEIANRTGGAELSVKNVLGGDHGGYSAPFIASVLATADEIRARKSASNPAGNVDELAMLRAERDRIARELAAALGKIWRVEALRKRLVGADPVALASYRWFLSELAAALNGNGGGDGAL